MNHKLILAVLIVLLAISTTFFVRTNQKNYSGETNNITTNNPTNNLPNNTQESNTNPPATEDQTENGLITPSVLSVHDSRSDCWVAYKGKVYDITSWLPRHPGSAGKILPYCGTSSEFERTFEDQHGTSQVKKLMNVGVLIGDFDVMGSLSN